MMCTCYQPWGSILPAPPCPAHTQYPPPFMAEPQTWSYTLAPEPTPEHPMVVRARKYLLRRAA